jgi:hypothetical protein
LTLVLCFISNDVTFRTTQAILRVTAEVLGLTRTTNVLRIPHTRGFSLLNLTSIQVCSLNFLLKYHQYSDVHVNLIADEHHVLIMHYPNDEVLKLALITLRVQHLSPRHEKSSEEIVSRILPSFVVSSPCYFQGLVL